MIDGQRTVSAGGVDHWVRVAGGSQPGVPVVLVHGGPGATSYPYEALGDRLAERMPVVFYDQRGCGRSAHPARADTYTFAQLVRDLDHLRAELHLEAIIPWGVSFGCVIAAE